MKRKKKHSSTSGKINPTREASLPPPAGRFLIQWLFFAAISAAYIILLRFIHEPTFFMNDNLAIIAFAKNGFIAPAFVHFLWINLLSWLYASAPQVPWYGLCLYALQAVSLSLVLTCFYRMIHSLGFFCLLAFIIMFFWSDMMVRLDFSGTSIMMGTGALLLFFRFHREGLLNAKNALLPGLILSVSVLIRLEGILAVTAIAAPFLGFFLLLANRQSPRPGSTLWRKAILFTCLFLPAFLIYSTDGAYRKYFLPENDAAYARLHSILQKFQDTPLVRENRDNQKALEAAGWTGFDLIRLEHWMFFDENIYHAQSFENFYQHAAKPAATAMEFSGIIDSVSSILKNYSPFFLLMAAGYFLALGRKVYALKDFLMLCMTGAAMFGIALFLDLFLRFPSRIGYPMLFSAGLLVFFFSLSPPSEKQTVSGSTKNAGPPHINTPPTLKTLPAWIAGGGRKNLSLTLALPLAVLLAIPIHHNALNEKYQSTHSYHQFNQNLTRAINTLVPGSFLIAEPLISPFHFIDPISPPETNFTRIPLGWSTFSPLFYQTLGEMGLKRGSDLVPAMMVRDDILVVSREPWMLLLLNYAHEQGLGAPQFEILAEIGIAKLYRLKQESR